MNPIYLHTQIMGILDILTQGIPQLRKGYKVSYSWQEYNSDTGDWKQFTTTVLCNDFYLNRIKEDELFYSNEPYFWQAKLTKIESV